jgi:hypothetical protein
MMTMRFSMVMAGLVALTAVACGGSSDDDGGGNSGQIQTSIPASTPASELSDAQSEELCKAAGDAAQATFGSTDAKSYGCGFTAYIAASLTPGDASACKKFYDECMKAPVESDGAEQCEKPSSACQATVGELEACWNDAMSQSLAGLAQLPGCDDVGKDRDGAAPGDAPAAELPASCQVIEQKCPEALKTTPSADAPFEE